MTGAFSHFLDLRIMQCACGFLFFGRKLRTGLASIAV